MVKKNTIKFDAIAADLFSYVCGLYQPGERFPYPLQKGQKGTLLGSVFSVYIAFMFHKEQHLPGVESICREVLTLRDSASGLFEDPDLEPADYLNPAVHSQLYVTLQTTSFCYACLHALNVSVDRRVYWLSPLLEKGCLEQWLQLLDWQNPWLVSNLDMFVGIFLLEWRSYDQENKAVAHAVETYFRWHNETQVRRTGYWGNQDDLLNAMAGAYHILIHYDYSGLTINNEKAIIDSTLSLVCRDGLFVYGGGGGSCEDMDAIDILVRLSLITDYRQADVKMTLLRAASMLSMGQCSDGGFSWRVQPQVISLSKIKSSAGMATGLLKGLAGNLLYKLLHRSHYCSTHFYSNLSIYPFMLMESDMWSSWFRSASLAFIARRYPEAFKDICDWRLPFWPGLGYDPFISGSKNKSPGHGTGSSSRNKSGDQVIPL